MGVLSRFNTQLRETNRLLDETTRKMRESGRSRIADDVADKIIKEMKRY